MLRAMTNPKIIKKYTLNQMLSLAKESWDAIQASLAEREKGDLTELKALAQQALLRFNQVPKWIAVDWDGRVWAYELEPHIIHRKQAWDNADTSDFWEIGKIAPPEDYRKELYRISEILSDDL